MKSIPRVLACSAFLFAVSAQAQDPLAVGGDMYKKLLENDKIRVMEVTFDPGEKIGLHSHPDHLGYVLEGGSLVITANAGKPNAMTLKTGDSVWIPAETHQAENNGKSKVRILVVELKNPPKK